VGQAKPENQGLLRHLQKCRVEPNLDCLDRLLAAGVGQVQDQGGPGNFWNSLAWPKPCSWNAWTCGRCSVFVHPITDNPYYSISLPDSSVFSFNIPDNYHSILSLIGLLKSNKPV
jgi:hypothetical protein